MFEELLRGIIQKVLAEELAKLSTANLPGLSVQGATPTSALIVLPPPVPGQAPIVPAASPAVPNADTGAAGSQTPIPCQALAVGHKSCPCGAAGCGEPGTNDAEP